MTEKFFIRPSARTLFWTFICRWDYDSIFYGFREHSTIKSVGPSRAVPSIIQIFGNLAFFNNLLWENDATDFHEIFRVCYSCHGLCLCKFSWLTDQVNRLKAWLENRDFRNSLYFYIVDSGKRIFQDSKNSSATTFSISCWYYWLVQLPSALRADTHGIFSFPWLRALASALIYK